MDHFQFMPFHNRLIKFKVKGESTYKEGAVVDLIPYTDKHIETLYVFIPRNHMQDWREAEKAGDIEKMKLLQEEIDIQKIESAEAIFKPSYNL